tara:strand:+ start:495 stop:632 length:138 start_codon:yes stop_codon:yes gene_type:complete
VDPVNLRSLADVELSSGKTRLAPYLCAVTEAIDALVDLHARAALV